MKKICRIGTVEARPGKWASVYISITFVDGKLSISGVIGPTRGGNAIGSAGQIDTDFAHRNSAQDDQRNTALIKPHKIHFAKGWNARQWLTLLEYWHEWHLNDLTAGSPRQEAYLAKNAQAWNAYQGTLSHYEWACEVLTAASLQPDREYLHDGQPYRYGSAWLRRDVPQRVIDFLMILPEADQPCPWRNL